jgi:hypothetical protein
VRRRKTTNDPNVIFGDVVAMVDLDKIVESVVADLLPEAAARDIDLGFALADREDKPPAVVICGDTHAWLAANVLG